MQELVLGDVDELEEVGGEGVPVLLEEGPRVVEDDTSKMVEPEASVDVGLGLQVVAVITVTLVELIQQGLIGALGELALLVNQTHEVERPNGDEVEGFLVVHELDMGPVDGLQVVLLLLELEDVLDKELLEVLVGKVDAKLLEGVGLEVLKAEDVEDADAAAVGGVLQVWLEDSGVDLPHNINEEAAVDALGKGVPHVPGLMHVEGADHRLALGEDGAAGECVDERLLVHAQDGGHAFNVALIWNVGGVEVVDDLALVLDVSHVQEGGQDLEDVPDLLVSHHEHLHG